MFENLKSKVEQYKEKRAERKARPWSRKQKIIFLSVFGALVLYIIISSFIQGNIEIPTLHFNINGIDVAIILLALTALAVIKIKKYFKSKKGE